MTYTVQYRKRDYLIWSYQRIVRNKFIAECVFFTFLISLIFFHLNNTFGKSYSQLQEINVDNDNVIFVIDSDQHANSLQPLYCNLHKKGKAENVNTHVIVTGRGISGKELRKSNSLLSNCDVPVYDLELKKSKESIFISVIQDLSSALDQIQPDVLIYINDPKNEAMRGVDAALIDASQTNHTITKIALPIEDVKYMIWLTELPIEALKNWNTPNILIQVITQDRPQSLARLMQSLNSSIYFGDKVHLTLNIDRSADPVTVKYCKTFEWPHGQINNKYRIKQGGLVTSIVESYYPITNDDYAIILEDDIEVSPFYYIWAKYTILKYRYGTDRNLVNRLYGVSLYNTRLNEFNITTGRRRFNPVDVLENTKYPNNSPYLIQVPCSWGALFFPEVWREFHDYLKARLDDTTGPNLQQIEIPESRSNMWTSSWKRFFIELIYLRGYMMLYPNYEDFISFSTNHAETGVHFGFKKKEKGLWLLPLMEEDMISEGLPDGHLPDYKDLPTMDFWGNLVPQEELIRRGRSLHSKISICPPNEIDELTYDPQDLLCVEKSTLSNDVYKIEITTEETKN
ncbi:glycosyltransferase 2 [Gigaspora margarita]|uniref:Glycosyltransferase 2 n=1 Tax=Gigaspora margarita TaxID=4874 RepID=A0A8H4ANM4_GIGMA|nr:glycosyltransferase 2 [Gigaspora margarita]